MRRITLLGVLSAAAAATLVAGATSASAGVPFGHQGPPSLAHQKHVDLRELALVLRFDKRYRPIVAGDGYVGRGRREIALRHTAHRIRLLERGERQVRKAHSQHALDRAMSTASPTQVQTPGRKHYSLRQLRNGTQLDLDADRAVIEVTRAHDRRHGITQHPDFARQLRHVARLKVEVDRAKTRERVLALRERE